MTVRDDRGNVCVDFVWGNFPLQPNDDRGEGQTIYTPQVEDAQWTQARLFVSDSLNPTQDSHSIATTGYANFPAFIPDYAGDGDTGFESVVPNLIGKTAYEAGYILDGLNLGMNTDTVAPELSYAETTETTVTITVDDTYNLRKGDSVFFANVEVDGTPVGLGYIQLTKVTPTTVEFANDGLAFDATATGQIWGVSTSNSRVISQDPVAGDIVDQGSSVLITRLYVD